MKLSKAEQRNAQMLIDDLPTVREWLDEHLTNGTAIPARIIYEGVKGQLSRTMTRTTFAASFSANVRLGTLGNIKGQRPKGYVRVPEKVEVTADTVRAPTSKKLKRSSALGPVKPAPEPEPDVPEPPTEYRNDTAPLVDEDEPAPETPAPETAKSSPPPEPEAKVEPVNAVAAAPSLKPVQRPATPEPDAPLAVPAAHRPMEPVAAKPQVGPEPKAKPQTAEEKSKAVRAIVDSIGSGTAPEKTQKKERTHARHVWVGRKLYRVRGGFDTLHAVVFSVLRGKQTEDGEVVFDGKRWGGFDAELFERIIIHTLFAWQQSSDSEPVLDDGSGIPVELRIEDP